MSIGYAKVKTRFLRPDERLMLSEETEMPLVIEPDGQIDVKFLQNFLSSHSTQLLNDMAKYGAVLLRGFDIHSDEDFENTVLSIQGLSGISEAFMSEQGRTRVTNLKYVLHTNSVYKTGGTLYLGGFHCENYYSPDVPTYISFCCLKPSTQGGETGLVNMEKVYAHLSESLQQKLEKNTFFVGKWLISEVAKRYKISPAKIEKICQQFDLPVVGKGKNKFILMYKPNVFTHPVTNKKSLGINLFELPTLNHELRKCFANDYQGKTWFWHRLFWKMPAVVFKILEFNAVILISLFNSPKESFQILKSKLMAKKAAKKIDNLPDFNSTRVGSCFNKEEIKQLAKLIRNNYSSCLWKKGDILLVDNRKIMHAGMPGSGPRLIRALICNPMAMKYEFLEPGYIDCKNRETESIGFYMSFSPKRTSVR